MGKAGSAGLGSGGITRAMLAKAGITVDSPAGLSRAWKSTFGKQLSSPSEVRELMGLSASDMGERGSIHVAVGPGSITAYAYAQASGVQMSRTFRNGTARHDTLFIDASRQGQGIGSRILRNAVASYERLGIKSVSLQAAEAGRYVWPKMGFRVSSPQMAQYRSGFTAFAKSQGYNPAGPIRSVQQIANTTIGSRKIGKEYLLSKSAPNLSHMTIRTSRLKKGLK
jgi:GNAT superfamily N-acetyltransferase